MAILTKPQITKDSPAIITLNKADLLALPEVAADSFFSDSANWNTIIIKYRNINKQRENLLFNAADSSPTATFLVSERIRNDLEVQKLMIIDHDGGILSIPRSALPVADMDISFGSSIVPLGPVVLYLPLTGAEGASVFADTTLPGRTSALKSLSVTNVQTTTAESFNNTSSARFNGGYIAVQGNDPDFDFGTGDFSVSFRFKASGSNLDKFFVGFRAANGSPAGLHITTSLSGRLRVTDGNFELIGTTQIDNGSWHECIVKRVSGLLQVIVNSSVEASLNTSSSFNAENNRPIVGANDINPAFGLLNGWMQDLIITKG